MNQKKSVDSPPRGQMTYPSLVILLKKMK